MFDFDAPAHIEGRQVELYFEIMEDKKKIFSHFARKNWYPLKIAKNLLTRQRTELIRDPPLRQGENHPIRVMMEHLRSHYIPVNELRAIKAERAVKDVLLKRNEPLTKFLVRFEDGLNDAAAQGKIFTLIEKKAMLDSALKSGQRTMDNLITSLQMGEITWHDISSYLS